MPEVERFLKRGGILGVSFGAVRGIPCSIVRLLSITYARCESGGVLLFAGWRDELDRSL